MPATAWGLPRTRSLRRVPAGHRWWTALAIALGANLAVVLALSQVSRLPTATPEAPPLAVRTLVRHAPVPPPPREPVPSPAPAVPAAVPVAVPASVPMPPALVAPPLAGPAWAPALADRPPSPVPAAGLGLGPLPAASVLAGPRAPGPGAGGDQPAEREGRFDLDRYYPIAARQRGIAGSSRVRIAIDAAGAVTGVTILHSTPEGVFDGAAERLARTLRFRPARHQGQAVPSVQDTDIQWSLQ